MTIEDGTMMIETAFALAPRLLEAAFMVVAAASAIAALTPTPRDDELVGKIYRLIDVLALNVGRAKDLPQNRAGGRFTPD